MLEGADVATLTADDPPLHVVRRELHERRRRLGGVAGSDPLEGIGDEIPGAPFGLGLRLLLHLTNPAGEVVAHELFGLLEQMRLGLAGGPARAAPEGPGPLA